MNPFQGLLLLNEVLMVALVVVATIDYKTVSQW